MDEDEVRRVEVRVLGRFEVCVDGKAAALRPQALRLLALLAIHANEPVSRSTIVEAMWDGGSPEVKNEANYIQVHVRAIRKVLTSGGMPRDALEFAGQGRYKLRAPPVAIDLGRFEGKLAAAQAAVDEGLLSEASQMLSEALQIGNGVALDGVDGLFAHAESARLEERKLAVLLRRIDVDLWIARYAELVPELTGLTMMRRTDDRFRMRLMIALHDSDRSSEALAVFRAGRQIVSEELGLDPGQTLQVVHQAILAGTPAQELLPKYVPLSNQAGSMPDHGGRATRPRQLPAAVSNFTGRASEMTELDQTVTAARPRSVMVISGAGGVGKTALALAWANHANSQFPDGHLYLDLHGYSPGEPADPADALAQLLEALGTPQRLVSASAEARAHEYRSKLAGKRMLIVLDNAGSAAQVRPLLPGTGGCMTLVTSRSSLSGLVARDGARRINIGPLPLGESVGLLTQIIGHARVSAEPQAAAEVAQACGCLPLALRIAAERVADRPRMTLAALASELSSEENRLDLLNTPDGDPASAVRPVFSWSYRALGTDAKRVFRLLGLARGPDIGLPAVAALCQAEPAAAKGVLSVLCSEHILEEITQGRYRCHDLLRLYAAERAGADETRQGRDEAVRSLLTWYLHTSSAADRLLMPRKLHVPQGSGTEATTPLKFTTPAQALAWCETEKDNLVAAVRGAAVHGLHTIAWKLSASMWGFFYLRKTWEEWKTTHQIGLESARRAPDRFGEALMLFGLGTACWSTNEPGQAIERYEEALLIWRQIGHAWGEAMTLNNLGAARCSLGQFRQALVDFRNALHSRRAIGDEQGQAQTMINIGEAMLDLGNASSSYRQTLTALELCQKLNYRYGEAMALFNLAASAMQLGWSGEALRHLNRSLELRRRLGDQQGEAEALMKLGEIYHMMGNTDLARKFWQQAVEIFDQLGDPQAEAARALLRNLASVRDKRTKGTT